VERLFWSIATAVNRYAQDFRHIPEELRILPKLLADKYFCNFSLFHSLPDSWAIDQLFPIMPLQRLNEKPLRRATLHDITCDSDGRIDRFIGIRETMPYLSVHDLRESEPYYIGVFLVGAYQEILGDLHNLFGDTNAVHIVCDEDSYWIDQIIEGETIEDVLDYVQFSAKRLVRTMETWVMQAVKENMITLHEGKEFLAMYRSGLYGYTYLE
jgi:arginine decarboxylase